MIILSIRTSKPEAEIGLFNDKTELIYEKWEAHRKLAETIHQKIEKILDSQNKTLADIDGIVAYKGPGSFTGLRIGLAVVNSLAYGLEKPIVGEEGEEWLDKSLTRMTSGKDDKQVIPVYGAPVHITTPKK